MLGAQKCYFDGRYVKSVCAALCFTSNALRQLLSRTSVTVRWWTTLEAAGRVSEAV